MSWVQLFGDTWRTTGDVVEFKLTLCRDDALCPRQVWSFALTHLMPRLVKDPALSHAKRMLDVEAETLGFSLRDWRELAGRELRADAAWHEKHGCCHEYGGLLETSLGVREMDFSGPAPGGVGHVAIRDWRAVDFVLRTGALGGLEFPVELDAWLVPKAEFWRREPECEEELARFGRGEPNLRVMATGFLPKAGCICLPARTRNRWVAASCARRWDWRSSTRRQSSRASGTTRRRMHTWRSRSGRPYFISAPSRAKGGENRRSHSDGAPPPSLRDRALRTFQYPLPRMSSKRSTR